ncbi:nucleotide-binding oligomerization domain-containing protein 2-like [Conger conger]|uniref:nucleotide-binding oligomerization domain-containing protein 2-like n=1 Tax=Conger conger TaxID=82655 RepID=UPI002A5A3817|nr:nucleotide-binding oligomerization domain-containing protein 2-like [Conger conger]XP_061104308.1 nucleotide-binding oligomerization domain-containing protein 2-like [Conger conger]
MSLRGDLQERLPDAEMNWSAEEEEEEEEEEGWGPERNIFLLRGETSAGAAAGLKRPRDNRPPSPAPSYDSMTSDVQSDELRFDDDFSDGNEEPLPTGPSLQLERPDSSASSCCSMASDVSTESFSVGPRPRTKELDKEEVKALLGVSAEERHPAMSSAFMSQALQATLAKLKEGYLRYFKSCLVERYPQIFTSSVQEFEIPGLVDKMLERCDIEGSLKISLLILEDIELQYDANSLRGMCKRHEMQYDLKASLKEKYSLIFEGLEKHGSPTLLDDIFTELHITAAGNARINTEHELRQIGKMVPTESKEPNLINCRELFQTSGGYREHLRFLMLKGIAGAGKSVCVQRFILDWAKGEGDQGMYFVFPIPFQELNCLASEQYSLIELIHLFFPEMKKLDTFCALDGYKVLFIFDGLDECELPLRFSQNEMWCSQTSPTSMDRLLTNLFKGNIYPCAHIWVTSRPAATKRIHTHCIHRVAELRGFNDAQKEEYFKKTINDQTLANKIITHLQSEKSLSIMCHLPLFCWTVSDMLQKTFRAASEEIPNVTEIFTQFLLVQLNTTRSKYHRKEQREYEEERDFLMILGKQALQMLEQSLLVLSEEQWGQTGIGLDKAAVHSGFCTEIIKETYALYRDRMYCFVHLYIQEYLAALYVFLCFKNQSRNILDSGKISRMFKTSLTDVHKSAVDRALQCANGHFHMFLRFLLGMSLGSNVERLEGIVTKVGGGTHLEKTAQYIKSKLRENHSEEKLKHLRRCLTDILPLHSTA